MRKRAGSHEALIVQREWRWQLISCRPSVLQQCLALRSRAFASGPRPTDTLPRASDKFEGSWLRGRLSKFTYCFRGASGLPGKLTAINASLRGIVFAIVREGAHDDEGAGSVLFL